MMTPIGPNTVNGQTTNYALDIANGLPEVIYASQSETYLYLPSVIVTQKATEVRYLLSNGLGSIRQAVDETGAVVAYHEFDPYGNPVVGEGNPQGYGAVIRYDYKDKTIFTWRDYGLGGRIYLSQFARK